MSWTPIALGTRSNPARHGHTGAARLINCFSENAGQESKEQWIVHACDGFEQFSVLSDSGEVRALLDLTDSELYTVAGRLVFVTDSNGSSSVLGGLPSDGMVTMARNRAATPQIAIVCDGLYFKIESRALTRLADPDLPPPVSVGQINGYFIFFIADGRHFASDLDDWDVNALSFSSAAYNPDRGLRNVARGNEMLFFGSRSIEAWSDVGGDPYPLERSNAIDIGLLSPRGVASISQTVAFVAHDFTVRMLDGYRPVRISDHALERLIEAETDRNDIKATSYSSGGHDFFVLSAPSWTWVFNMTTQRWHERKSYGLDRWKVSNAIRFGERTILGDYQDGTLYRLAPTMSVSAGRTDQVLMLDYSDDGGATWSAQRLVSLGDLGQRLKRARFHSLGIARSRTYRMSMNCASEAGDELVMMVQTPPVHAEPYRLKHNTVNVDVVPGLGGSSSSMSIVSMQADVEKLRA